MVIKPATSFLQIRLSSARCSARMTVYEIFGEILLQQIDINAEPTTELELDDIQSGVLRPRPTPYVAAYIGFRIDDRKAGRALMDRVSRVVTSAANPTSPLADTWVSVALTYQGLKALGVPQETLESFSWEFRQGMAARA